MYWNFVCSVEPKNTKKPTPEKEIVKEEPKLSVDSTDDSPIKVKRRSAGSRKRILSSSEEDSENEQTQHGGSNRC